MLPAPQLGDLFRHAAHGRETIALAYHRHVTALLVSPQVIEDLEDALAVADYQLRKERGELGSGIPHEEVRRMLRAAAVDLRDHLGTARHKRSCEAPKGRAVGLSAVYKAIDSLATQPRPHSSIPYGSQDVRRLRVGEYRVLYIIDDDVIRILVTHLG